MGAVWLAEHTMLGRRAAIKVLHAEYTARQEIVARFFNEARAATAIADPGIVQIFDFGHHTDGSAYIVMELLEGEPLDKRLARQGPLGVAEALRIMRQVAGSLGAAHASGIVHRDLKPENVFLVRDQEVVGGERAKILDFGIAKLLGDQAVKTKTSAVMGTPAYMSPEQCRGAGRVDQRSDVYALGCLLFTLLTGRPPFDSEGVGEIIAMHLREPPPAPSQVRPGIPPDVDQLVLRCLAKDPAQRFAHGGELALAIGILTGTSLHGGVKAPVIVSAPLAAVASPIAVVALQTDTIVSSATTLSAAAGATVLVGARRRRRLGLIVGVSAGVAGVVIAMAAMLGSSDGSEANGQAPAGTVVPTAAPEPEHKAAEPARVEKPARAVAPDRAAEPARAAEPETKAAEPARGAEPANVGGPAKPLVSAKAPVKVASPVKSAPPVKVVAPIGPASPPVTPAKVAAPSSPAAPAKPEAPSPPKKIELDENGLPISR